MSHYRFQLIALVLAAALSAAACSDDTGANNGSGPNNGQADVTDDTQQPLDAADEEDSGPDTDESDESDTDQIDTGPSEPRWLPDFQYRNPNGGNGVSVNVQSGRIGKIGTANTRTEPMTAQEITDLKAEILTEATRDKMISGWDCGDATEIDGVQWIFEGQVLVDVDSNTYDEIITNVAGCTPADSTEADAARVQEIIQHLDDLRDDHFD